MKKFGSEIYHKKPIDKLYIRKKLNIDYKYIIQIALKIIKKNSNNAIENWQNL